MWQRGGGGALIQIKRPGKIAAARLIWVKAGRAGAANVGSNHQQPEATMDYKSYFTIWDGRPDTRPALDLALTLTRQSDGHLDMLCIAPTAPDTLYSADMSVQALQDLAIGARDEANRLKAEADALIDAAGVSGAARAAPVRFSEVAGLVGREGRFHDLIIMPRPFPSEPGDAVEDALDGALFETSAPVLVCPPRAIGQLGRNILVAWNGDQEAMRAIRAAQPMLKTADQVEVVMVDPRRTNDPASPGFALMAMLTRLGVNAVLSPISKTSDTVSETLRQKALDMGADLIVMGAYGHSRFRERLLGGATREMLQKADVPVMMTH